MKKVGKKILRALLFVGLPLLICILAAYFQRGYFAIGGEVILPLLGLIYLICGKSVFAIQK